MRILAVSLAAAAFAFAAPPVRAESPSPSPQPAASPATSPAATTKRLNDAEIRRLLVGNSYTVDYRDAMRLTIEVHPDGTLYGYVSEGNVVSRSSAAAARAQDDGKYTIENGQYCWIFNGAWARKEGKPVCVHITQTNGTYVMGKTPMTINLSKH